jgi:hypothetical protein
VPEERALIAELEGAALPTVGFELPDVVQQCAREEARNAGSS